MDANDLLFRFSSKVYQLFHDFFRGVNFATFDVVLFWSLEFNMYGCRLVPRRTGLIAQSSFYSHHFCPIFLMLFCTTDFSSDSFLSRHFCHSTRPVVPTPRPHSNLNPARLTSSEQHPALPSFNYG